MGTEPQDGGVTSMPILVLAGFGVGLLYGLFGVGSAFATPLLALLGVPGLAAVASPLPALVPGSAGGGWAHARRGHLVAPLARRTLLGAAPACIAGSIASRWVGGPWLLVLSGACLVLVGLRVVVTTRGAAEPGPTARALRQNTPAIVAIGALVGFIAGLLANGGGFLLVPTFLLGLGLTLPEATATSLVVVAALSIPAVLTHALLGDIDWAVALPFAAGLVPATALAAALASRLDVAHLRNAFGVLLVAVGGWFLYHQLHSLGLV
jgi:uncharacterized membrane protein YfcA